MPRTYLALPLLALAAVACRAPETHVHHDRPAEAKPEHGQFAVTGTAEVKVRPDVVDLHLTIAAEAPKAKAAAQQLRARQVELRAALVAAGIAAEDLSFSSLGIEPVYVYDEHAPPRLRGYRATIDLTATTKQFETLPDVLEAAVTAGATNVTTERRVLDLPTHKREVRDLALAAAKAKAEQTASALGVKLGRITAISESSDDGTGWNGRWNRETVNIAQTAVAAPPSLGPMVGDAQTLTLTISLSYEL